MGGLSFEDGPCRPSSGCLERERAGVSSSRSVVYHHCSILYARGAETMADERRQREKSSSSSSSPKGGRGLDSPCPLSLCLSLFTHLKHSCSFDLFLRLVYRIPTEPLAASLMATWYIPPRATDPPQRSVRPVLARQEDLQRA